MRNLGTIGWAALAILLLPWVGRAGDGIAALQTADPSCADGSGNIYVDCGNGTVTDNRTGLVWLAKADCFSTVTWHDAMKFVGGLADLPASSVASADDCGLSDGSSAGEWRLPSTAEWEAMIANANGNPGELNCSPTITTDRGNLCWGACALFPHLCSFSSVQSLFYWSSSTDVSFPAGAFVVFLGNGNVLTDFKSGSFYVWPVRGGQ